MGSKKDFKTLKFEAEWYLSAKEVQARKEFIDEAISYWVDKGIVTKNYFEHRAFKVFLRVLPQLRPIPLGMIDDFILGLILLPYPKYEDEVNTLLKPASDIMAEFYFTEEMRNGMIDRNVSANDMMLIDGWDTENTRAALKEALKKDKFALPYNKEKIDRLKVEYKKQQKKKYQQIQKELSGNLLIGFACPLHPDTVKEVYKYMISKNYIEGSPADFQAIFANKSTSVLNPITWLIKSKTTTGGRGNQMKLYFFLEKMLQRRPTNDDKRKAAKLFIDEEGEFFNPKMKKPDEYERISYDIFAKLLEEIHPNKK